MKIVDYDLNAVPPRWSFLLVETDTGLVGRGELVVEGRTRTDRIAAEELMDASLLGGKARDRIRVHQWIGGDRPGAVRDAVGPEVDIDVSVIEARAGHDDWHNPVWQHPDGSVAQW